MVAFFLHFLMLMNLLGQEKDPLITIILPTFNRKPYLRFCIQSVISQTFSDWELMIVDDGSNDGSWEVIQSYIDQYPNIQGIRQRNKGLALARNTGIQISRGIFITFIDSDDRYKKNHLEKRIHFMVHHPEIDLIHGGVEILGDPYVVDKNNLQQKIHLNNCPIGGTIFCKREVLRALNGFNNIPYGEDSDLVERAEQKFLVEKVHFPTYTYDRTTPGSITNILLQKQFIQSSY